MGGQERKADGEGGTRDRRRRWWRAGVPPCSSVRCLRDGQAQAEAAVTARGRGVGLAEAVEDLAEKLRSDPLAAVGHGDLDMGIDPLDDDVHAAVPWA